MLKIKAALVLLLVVSLMMRVILWAVEPAIPLAVLGFVLIVTYSWIFKRKW